MNLERSATDKEWQTKVRKVDASIQAALTAERRGAAVRKQPFWTRRSSPAPAAGRPPSWKVSHT